MNQQNGRKAEKRKEAVETSLSECARAALSPAPRLVKAAAPTDISPTPTSPSTPSSADKTALRCRHLVSFRAKKQGIRAYGN